MKHNLNLRIFIVMSLVIHAGFIFVLLPHILSTGTGGGGNNNLSGHFFELNLINEGIGGIGDTSQRDVSPSTGGPAGTDEAAATVSLSSNQEGINSADPAAGGDSSGNSYGGDTAAISDPFIRLIREKIEKVKSYPEVARHNNWVGEVELKFLITSNGEVKEIKLVKSSGFSILDKSAVATVKNAAPFLPFPEALANDGILVSLPIVFALR